MNQILVFGTILWFTTLLSTTHTSADLNGGAADHNHHLPLEAVVEQESMDLLEATGLFGNLGNYSIHHQGIVLRPGPHSSAPAAFFTSSLPQDSPQRRLKIQLKADQKLWNMLSKSELALMASVKQWKGNSGTLLSLTMGSQRIFEIQSSGRTNQLRVMYRTQTSIQAVETLDVTLADNQWHKLAITVSGNQLHVFLDCQSIHKRLIRPLDFRISKKIIQDLALWIGQQTEQKFLYKGYIQNFYLVSGQNGHGLQCPSMPQDCPTCGEFRKLQSSVSELQYQYLHYIQKLEEKLEAVEARLAKVEACDCQKSCRLPGGLVREDGASWSDDKCQLCSCVHGVVTCRPPTCPTLNCTDPNPPDSSRGICCPSCKAQCRHFETPYSHGDVFSPKQCITCQCNDGHINCSRKDPQKDCPALNCPLEDQVLEEGQCCSTCRLDFCSRGHDCHPKLAICVNGLQNYTCHCKEGYKGDGKYCEDHDECEQLGDRQQSMNHGIGGHFCTQANSICVNTLGSYKCECQQGFESVISSPNNSMLNCEPINHCLNTTTCHANASCHYLGPDQFLCTCHQGYTGNGTHCSPVCSSGCENGGSCVGPDQCTCPYGFEGAQCQTDIDECSRPELQKCASDSICVNKPGWHYCKCKPGYKAYQDPSLDGATICIDENECDLGTHTCHPTAQCWNTAGSFQCYCGFGSDQNCSSDCMVDNSLHSDGSQWFDNCQSCQCHKGVVTCEIQSCNCSNNKSLMEVIPDHCCPQCPPRQQDSNVEQPPPSKCLYLDREGVPLLNYHHGQKWLSQCQECECMNGEIDCWPMECPPTFCSQPILRPGHCCPTCEDKSSSHSCLNGNGGHSSNDSSSCLHFGSEYQNGQSWAMVDTCTSCNCRDGQVYCSTSSPCLVEPETTTTTTFESKTSTESSSSTTTAASNISSNITALNT